ncbi:DUF4314 domain-containing protein [Saccharothrix sp. HUAS TT1]|uniref:DUF4314 domain-containing protein n=1 Tax=Saccharothrix sp. HUAS TT1 TaxID=3231910 RepID=UPI00345B9474
MPPVPVELFRHFTPYQPGRRVELVSMADEHTRLRPGTRGTIAFVDDLRTVHIAWDNGSRLAAIVHDGTDVITLLEK